MKPAAVAVAVLVIAAGAWLLPRPASETTTAIEGPPAAATPSVAPDHAAVGTTPTSAPSDAGQLALEIERTLVAVDPAQRETAFAQLLPRLLREDPQRVAGMLARQPPGGARDALRHEVTRQWTRLDRDAAVAWMKSLADETERRDSATIAMRTLAASSPAEAIAVADQFGVGRDDGSLEHLVQIWATEDPEAASRWIATQPADDPRTRQLRTRIEQVRASARPATGGG